MIYTSAEQVSALVPFSLEGTSVRVQVEYQGSRSNNLVLDLAAAAPAIFTLAANGLGQGAVLNQDFSVNSASNPAPRGSAIMIFATGGGQTNPPGVDGRLAPGNALASLQQPVSVRIGNVEAQVLYAGSAPGLVEGVIQVNAMLSANMATGPAVPILLRVGDFESPAGVTIAIR
jgi:uncharacterized protein (TIGR03437 family)